MKQQKLSFHATVSKNMESFLVDELRSLGAEDIKESLAGASFNGSMEVAYRACLWSRIANRILFPIAQFPAETPEMLYDGIRRIRWEDHLNNNGSLAVDFHSNKSNITHTQYGALKVKDGVVDYFRDKTGIRPSVELNTPDVRINVYLYDNNASVSIDLSGESLHRRGYRTDGAEAPLKENLAAAILTKAAWQDLAQSGGCLVDPMCGSGTFPIEAALMAGDYAPGLLRSYFGFLNWNQYQSKIWKSLIREAIERKKEGLNRIPSIIGYDSGNSAIRKAFKNLERADLSGSVHFEKKDLADCVPTAKTRSKQGLVIVNPPYGIRLGEVRELRSLYSALGHQLKTHFEGWKAGVFTGNPDLGKTMGIRACNKRSFFNGSIPCELLLFDIDPKWYVRGEHALFKSASDVRIKAQIHSQAEPFTNRIKKNRNKLKSWLQKEKISAYRVYDRDIPEFAVAVDVYDQWVHVQEYEAPKTIDSQLAQERLHTLLDALPIALERPAENIFLKVRRKQKGDFQYHKQASDQEFFQIVENNCRFWVNFKDYLDTGLFLDHRLTRKMIANEAKGKHFLNLFSYTGTASVYAAKGGARSTTSVDMSHIYADWAKRNMALNGFSTHNHQFIVADCLKWLNAAKKQYDLIFLDPPTFSNSKKMNDTFDIQRDHTSLIHQVMKRLTSRGTLIFSNNYKKFKLDNKSLSDYHIDDFTSRTVPKDFSQKRPHQCWKITHHN